MAKTRRTQTQRRHTNERLRDRAPAPLIGYMRVSKADGSQVLDLQRDALLAAGISERHLYSDTASGKQDDRPGLAACLQALREGDTLVVWKLDRLGRSLRHLVNVVHDLASRGIGVVMVLQSTRPRLRASWSLASSRRSPSLSATSSMSAPVQGSLPRALGDEREAAGLR
jgi:hypothetical protein